MTDAFLVADCPQCNRRVLLSYDLDGDALITQCIHCSTTLDTEDALPADAAELAELGYIVPSEQPQREGGGCRDGQCGVVQPDP